MVQLEFAVEACKSWPLYAPFNVSDQLDKVLADPENLLSSFLYILNMVDSRNLPWIDCVLANLKDSI